jgi:exosome complex exonuclease DIS3/RRP44
MFLSRDVAFSPLIPSVRTQALACVDCGPKTSCSEVPDEVVSLAAQHGQWMGGGAQGGSGGGRKRKLKVSKQAAGSSAAAAREHYLRSDIALGTALALPEFAVDGTEAVLDSSSEDPTYLLPDSTFAVAEADLLADPSVTDIVLLASVLNHAYRLSRAAHARIRDLTSLHSKRVFAFDNEHHSECFAQRLPSESDDARSRRAVLLAAKLYSRAVPSARIVVLSNDDTMHQLAHDEDLHCWSASTLADWKRSSAPHLLDLVSGSANTSAADDGGQHASNNLPNENFFEEHWSLTDITAAIRDGKAAQGRMRTKRFNAMEGFVHTETSGTQTALAVSGRANMNRAVDGDTVAVVELSAQHPEKQQHSQLSSGAGNEQHRGLEGDWDDSCAASVAFVESSGGESAGAEGDAALDDLAEQSVSRVYCKVIGIIHRAWRSRGYCASLQLPKDDSSCYKDGDAKRLLAVPVERKYPPIALVTRQAGTLMDKRIIVAIDGWNVSSKHPHGHYVRSLGYISDKETETDVTLHEHDIETGPFSEAAFNCLPPLPWRVRDDDRKCREDLTSLCIFCVDPPGAKDLDDALHYRVLPDGNIEVGVHIADVSHFVDHGCALDKEASKRATTTYLTNRRIDMLPKSLTEDICSLTANEERLSFSFVWHLNYNTLEVEHMRCCEAVVKPRAALTYQQAQARIEDENACDEISSSLKELCQVARVLRWRRSQRGALTLASPEVKFELDSETLDPMDVKNTQTLEANRVVEEMMLLANTSVARKVHCTFPSCTLLRRHPPPSPEMFEPLVRAARAVGVELDASTSGALGESLDKAQNKADPLFNTMLRITATRCMTQAVYFCSGEYAETDYIHYGLASPIYTHATSPIRRYADVVVHRLLKAALGIAPLPDSHANQKELKAVADNLNYRHRNAQLASRASAELFTIIYFSNNPTRAEGRIYKVWTKGLIVFLPKYGLEGPAYFEYEGTLADDGMRVTTSDGSNTYRVFDKILVFAEVKQLQARRRELRLRLIEGSEPKSEPSMTSNGDSIGS